MAEPGDDRQLVLVGAGGLGREALAAVRARGGWHVRGFVDDRPELAGLELDGVPVLGPIALLTDGSVTGAAALVCTGRPGHTRSRREIGDRLVAAGVPLASVIHPSASLAEGTVVGEGSLLLAQVVTTAPVPIGRQVVVMPHVVLTHDDVVGDVATFGAGARLAGGVTIGAGAYVGAGALVREHLTVGVDAVVGMGAVVTRDVPPGEVWAGNPARPLGPRSAEPAGRPPRPAVSGASPQEPAP